MPDHLHMICETGDQDLIKMLAAFKSFTTKQSWNFGLTGPLWQESFHDHGIRQVEDFDMIARYVYVNPERAGLCEQDGDYPWRGGAMVERDHQS